MDESLQESVELARLSPAGWARHASRTSSGRPRFHVPPHIRLLNRVIVETIVLGLRLLVSMPPRHGKSELISKATPAWFTGTWPDRNVIVASYEADFAKRFGRQARRDFEAHAGPVFGLDVAADSSAADRWEIAGHRGSVQTCGVGGALTGKGADLLIVDDPVKNAEDAFSQAKRDSVWDWWESTASTRLEPGGSAIVLMTRWHEDDLAGRLLKHEADRWRVVRLPAIAEDLDDPLGRREGEALWPERWPVSAFRTQRSKGYWWDALYQQRPTAREGGMVKRTWWKTYPDTPAERAAACSLLIQSWDMTFDETTDGSFVVGQVWGLAGGHRYLLDQVRARMDFVATTNALRGLAGKWPTAMAKLVEKKANGAAVISSLRGVVPGLMPVEVRGSKEARMAAHTPEIESGNVWLPSPEHAPWVHDYVEEMAAFPKGPNDDQVDATAQALDYLARQGAMQYLIT